MYRSLATSSGSGTWYRDLTTSSGSGGAFQPAESNADASQPGGLPTVRVNLGCFNCGIDKHGLLISGSLHIRTPHGKNSPTVATKKRITKAALDALEERAYTASSGASQPTVPVIVLTGDVTVGTSYADRGIRNDSHDFFGVALSIPMSDKHSRGQKRQQDSAGGAEKQKSAGGATQPASKEQRQDHDAVPEDTEEK